MLQQTRVDTVIPYFLRFVDRFPDPEHLAASSLDPVLHLWSGLGYYARARHLHAAALRIVSLHGGELPRELSELAALPGIGRSTAGAILAQAYEQRHPILDGNVKRVLARFHALAGWPGRTSVQRHLWTLAEAHTPRTRVADYTQAIMDLGATLCTRSGPACPRCPLAADCAAYRAGQVSRYPEARPTRNPPVRTATFILAVDPDGAVLLTRRPPAGIWGGLWCFPECPADTDPARWCQAALGLAPGGVERWPTLRHGFTHFYLDITPVRVAVKSPAPAVLDGDRTLWYRGAEREVGLPAPVAKLLRRVLETRP